ncbi:beta-microseminoprotein [Kogia breviceps]|uniref:beta-microseminoprotein n=1 Tax=Kogia breviceps TaxID=27615 RepID=UPI0034D342D5
MTPSFFNELETGGSLLATQNALLGSPVVLATFVTLCNAQCYIISNQNSTPNKCKDLDGVIHPLNSKWKTENCEECICDQGGINCCNTERTLIYPRKTCAPTLSPSGE